MNLATWLARSAQRFGQRPALLRGTQVVADYSAFADVASRLAGHWRQACGLQPGERVAVFMPNHTDYLVALYAAWWAGLVVVPLNAKLHAHEVGFVLQDASASALVTTAGQAADLSQHGVHLPRQVLAVDQPAWAAALAHSPHALEPRAGDDLAWLFYTSGTTGTPKGVMQTHAMLQAMTACQCMDVDAVHADDVMTYAAPMSHGAGIYNFAYVLRGARHLVPESGGFDAAELLHLSRTVGRLSLFAAPTVVRRLVDEAERQGCDGRGFRTIIYGGGPMYRTDIERALQVLGPCLAQIYGQGESPMTITALSREHLAERHHPRWAARVASVGVAQALVEVRVVDASGQPCKAGDAGEMGEVEVRGPTVMPGYWQRPEATQQALHDGWLRTGDVGTMDADGFLTPRDRSKDVVISGGSNIYPREVEEALLEHPRVREVAVVGEYDPEWGENVVAFVVADHESGGVNADELDALCLRRIARFKRPKRYEFVPSLPKNHYGKVLKTELRLQLRRPPTA